MFFVSVLAMVVVSLLVAVLVLGREKRIQSRRRAPVLFDVDAAVQWIGDALSPEMQATTSYDEVRQIVMLSIGYMRAHGMLVHSKESSDENSAIVGGSEMNDYVKSELASVDAEVTSEQIDLVLKSHIAYLDYLGAVDKTLQ
jgi:hypothetical protein